jgi:probable phosphoglycerate mutase
MSMIDPTMPESSQVKTNQRIMLVRHGETDWSLSGRHTSTTEIPLTAEGESRARRLQPLVGRWNFGLVLCSPRIRARRTCDLIGCGDKAIETEDLSEWNYGEYEGLTTPEIRRTVPGWTVFTQPCPGGETPRDVAERVDRVISRVRDFGGDTLLVAHSHSLRVLTARWLGLSPESARFFNLETGSWSVLGYEHGNPVLQVWSAPPA